MTSLTYPLRAKVLHMRRPDMPTLLRALARQAGKAGTAWVDVRAYLTGDGDYSALVVVDVPTDDGELADPAASQRQVEEFRQAELERLAALRRAGKIS